MVRTRLDTKFHHWKFELRNDDFFPCIGSLADHCEKISYEYNRNNKRGYTVYCTFYKEQRYDDIVDDICYFARNIYPLNNPVETTKVFKKKEKGNPVIFWMLVYIIAVLSFNLFRGIQAATA